MTQMTSEKHFIKDTTSKNTDTLMYRAWLFNVYNAQIC